MCECSHERACLPAPYTTAYTTLLVCSLSVCVTRSAGMSFLCGKRARCQALVPLAAVGPQEPPHLPTPPLGSSSGGSSPAAAFMRGVGGGLFPCSSSQPTGRMGAPATYTNGIPREWAGLHPSLCRPPAAAACPPDGGTKPSDSVRVSSAPQLCGLDARTGVASAHPGGDARRFL